MNLAEPTTRVIPLSDARTTKLAYAGGKGANLARLLNEGFPVPEGICVTTTVYDHLMDKNAITSLIDDLDTIGTESNTDQQAVASQLRKHIRNREIPDNVSDAVAAFIDQDTAYVVRSSATAEDLPTASFAGQHETILYVSGLDEVLDAISECMASLFTDRAVSYRTNSRISHSDVAIAVIVQRMVDADVSGVLFTADPLTGNRNIASIDAASGLGEAVVSGTVTADNARVNRETSDILEYRVGNQEQEPSGSEDKRILSDDQLLSLVRYGDRIEELFGSPQDIEWSITGEEIWILQSRPITSLFPTPSPEPEDDGLHVYYSYNHRQGMTDPMPPLSVDFVRRYGSWTLDTLFGYSPSTYTPMAGAGGLVYIDVTPMLRSDRLRSKWLGGIAELDKPGAELQRTIAVQRGHELSQASALGEKSLRTYLVAIRKLARIGLVGGARTVQGFLKRDYKDFPEQSREWYDEYAERTIASIRAGETEAERIRRAMEETSRFGWVGTRQLVTSAGLLSKTILRRLCPDSEDEFEALDKGMRGNVTIAMVLELGDIADLARESSAVSDAIISGKTLDDLRELDEAEQFVEAFEQFLDVYGHRASSELDSSKPRYCEDPSPLLGTIQMKLEGGEPGEHRKKLRRLEADAKNAIFKLERAADRGVFGPVRKRLVRPLAYRYRSYKSTRETPKYAYAYLWMEFRRQVLEAGDRLEREGRIKSVDDVWLFHLDELIEVLEHPDDLLDVDFAHRRSEYHVNQELNAPRVITSDGEIPRAESASERGEATFAGVATSNGTAEGIARIVHDPRTDRIEEGEILVCPYTDPGWTPLFLNAVGLVTNVGGVFSHGSLVAREYGIPSVVVDNATEKIESGQRIRVDGDASVVEILEDEA